MRNENEAAIETFLLDIDCLDTLKQWDTGINIFSVLRIAKSEIRHSNILAWILDPNESHGLGETVTRELLQHIICANREVSAQKGINIINTSLLDFYSFSVFREWNNIDILLISEKNKFLICIENKTFTSEHDDQLNRYYSIISNRYPEFRAMYLFLTPTGIDASDTSTWFSISYSEIIEIIEKSLGKHKNLSNEAELIINNYIQTIRRNIVEDKELQQICAEIYKKHKVALDLIFENRPDETSNMYEHILSYLNQRAIEKNDIILYPELSSKSSIFFTTPNLEKLFPTEVNDSTRWKGGRNIFYWVENSDKNIAIRFEMSSQGLDDSEYSEYLLFAQNFEKKSDISWNNYHRLKTWNIHSFKKKWNAMDFSEIESAQNQIIKQLADTVDKVIDSEKLFTQTL